MKTILLVTHELSNTGAPKALLTFAEFLKKLGHFVVVLSYCDGELKEEFKKLKIPVMVYPEEIVLHKTFWLKFFGVKICNTMICAKLVRKLEQKGQKVLWWIHEAVLFEDYMKVCAPNDPIKEAVCKAKNLYCISEYSKSFFEKYNSNIKILPLFVKDEYEKFKCENKNDKLKIAYTGEVIPLKGQDKFIKYFLNLDNELQNKFEINFIGRIADEEYFSQLKELSKNKDNIKFKGQLSHDKLMKELSSSDVFALFSRGDSFSIATAEGMMFDKKIMISQNTGIKDIIEKENCGYIIKNEEDFNNAIKKISDGSCNKTSSRKAFLEHFSYDNHILRIKKLIKGI